MSITRHPGRKGRGKPGTGTRRSDPRAVTGRPGTDQYAPTKALDSRGRAKVSAADRRTTREDAEFRAAWPAELAR
ncbi:hypothetical protein Asi03nite_75000 [Actinoplanes siamensis]|uniref:Uncharacterized protein n=1 Tax=Actinoplanes siamensis TaxID=1223317 RepID=A0A919NFN9_9ACTN|nr:hypothetical protein Asi03nite_75000 [Actinoplanes siamensis]